MKGVRETTTLVHAESLRARTLLNDTYHTALSRGGLTQPSFTRATPRTAQTVYGLGAGHRLCDGYPP